MLRRIVFTGLFLIVIGCDSTDFSVLDTEIVVELTLVASEPLPPARVSRLAPADQASQPENFAVSNAQVILSTGDKDLLMEPITDKPGSYQYLGPEHIIRPGARYDLLVTVPGVETTITGTTNVPTSIKILTASSQSGIYQSDEQLTLVLISGRSSGQSQSSFTLVTEALDVEEDGMVPSVAGLLEDDEELTLEDFRVSASPIITEANFTLFTDGTIGLTYPWIGINFYGRNIIYVNALDQNLVDFVRSAQLQQSGDGTFGPGVIPNVLPTLSGAHGVFGSVSRDRVLFWVFPPEEE
ncbi:MAG: DUF4249 family protein [Rhodothermaceae bacterium]|nr:DUF4249 family protein [Bacteroidota bacterium]MXW32837.1 DUF4249 family protein [Rhodothermaceae bacterium]MXZ17810.1 DUF4249 family protein [Rhodothermaceae bacterium]MYE63518.1 DUF4249 family protein [Rhodothermaceae bacterium]MYG68658.1 DUF4249 family protein [Rhodothermaceae bacterium]